MFGDQLISIIRTSVPLGVGLVVTFLATELGIVLDEATSAQAAAVAVTVVSGAYYAAVRALEERWPVAGTLLGSSRAPHYPKAPRVP